MAAHKIEGPSPILSFFRIEIDTIAWKIHLPDSKLDAVDVRLLSDLDEVTSIISKVNDYVKSNSVIDCVRLGQYSSVSPSANHRSRPLLVRMSTSRNVISILSKRGSTIRPYVIKPDMSPGERKIEAILLKERWLF